MRNDWHDRFVTMIVAVVNPRTNELTTVNAGHMAPLLRRTGGAVAEIGEEAAGLPLGVSPEFEYLAHTHVLEPGDVVTIFTDGFSEAMNSQRELYGLARLKQQITSPAVSVADFGQHILEDVSRFVDGFDQSDDMCLVCFGRVEESEGRQADTIPSGARDPELTPS
jgi:serine phosphatase RsbU (regulator of sigma subunit)